MFEVWFNSNIKSVTSLKWLLNIFFWNIINRLDFIETDNYNGATGNNLEVGRLQEKHLSITKTLKVIW